MKLAAKQTAQAQYLDVDGTTDKFATAMAPGVTYEFVANVDCWVAIEATGGAVAADAAAGILYVGQKLYLAAPDNTSTNSFVHVISDGVNGDACLYPVE